VWRQHAFIYFILIFYQVDRILHLCEKKFEKSFISHSEILLTGEAVHQNPRTALSGRSQEKKTLGKGGARLGAGRLKRYNQGSY